MKNITREVWKYFESWLPEYKKIKYDEEMIIPGEESSLTESDIKENNVRVEEWLACQIRFIKEVVSYNLIDANGREGLTHIKTFLQNQLNDDGPWLVNFHGCCECPFPQGLMANITDLHDIDFADVWGEQLYEIVSICQTAGTWTDKSIEEVRRHIISDFRENGMDAELTLDTHGEEIDYTGSIAFFCKTGMRDVDVEWE